MSQTSEYPKPLWPLPDGWEKPTIRIWGKDKDDPFHVHLMDITGGGWWPEGFATLDEALSFVRRYNRKASHHSEYTERREMLAEFLCDLVYGAGAWYAAEPDVLLNYRLDADDIIKANPHLLSLGERERLADQIPELAYP